MCLLRKRFGFPAEHKTECRGGLMDFICNERMPKGMKEDDDGDDPYHRLKKSICDSLHVPTLINARTYENAPKGKRPVP